MSVIFGNPDYGDETNAGGPIGKTSDHAVYQFEREMAGRAEPLGFDSLWSVEHHFTGYSMMPDVKGFLAYMAGQTRTLRLGTMVIVLPWDNPVRTAGSVAMLDNLSDGRFMLGIGRGLGQVEFEGLGIPMNESRERFVEQAEIVLEGLEQGYVEYDGKIFKQPKRWIRPAPVATFKGRTYASAVSPESFEIMARLGVGLLISPQKPFDVIIKDVQGYRETFTEINGVEPPEPIILNQVFCDEDRERAKDLGQLHIGQYYQAVMKHYELAGAHFRGIKGYEFYSKAAHHMSKYEPSDAERQYIDLQCYGTPDECVDRIAFVKESIGCSHFVATFNYGDMAQDEARRNLQLFNDKIQPRLKAM